MPKINKYRIINFEYGTEDKSRILSDEVVKSEGEMLLVEAPNSVGKSMCIHNLFQPILPLKNVSRKTTEVFTKKNPVYVLIEWLLDDEKTKFLTGIGLRRKSLQATSKKSMYDYFTFTVGYEDFHDLDIENTPIIKVEDGKKTYLKYEDALNLFRESAKSDENVDYFTKSNSTEYTEFLKEHGIYPEEWSSIMSKLNEQEASLGSFFDSSDTVPKMMNRVLGEIEDVLLDREGFDEIEKLRELAVNYKDEYNSLKGEINATRDMEQLKDKLEKLNEKISDILAKDIEYKNSLSKLKFVDSEIDKEECNLSVELDDLNNQLIETEREVQQLAKESLCLKYRNAEEELQEQETSLQESQEKLERLKQILNEKNEEIVLIDLKELNEEMIEIESNIAFKVNERRKKEIEFSELEGEIQKLGASIKEIYEDELNTLEEDLDSKLKKQSSSKELQNELKNKISKNNDDISEIKVDLAKMNSDLLRAKTDIRDIKDHRAKYLSENSVGTIKLDEDGLKSDIFDKLSSTNKRESELETKIGNLQKETTSILESNKELQGSINEDTNTLNRLKFELDEFKKIESRINRLRGLYSVEDDLWETSSIDEVREMLLGKKDDLISGLEIEREELENKIKALSGSVNINEEVLSVLSSYGIAYIKGFDYLTKGSLSIDNKKALVDNNPLLPFSLILSRGMYEKLVDLDLNLESETLVPIFIREDLESDIGASITNSVLNTKDFSFVWMFNKECLNAENLEEAKESYELQIEEINNSIKDIRTAKNNIIKDFSYETGSFYQTFGEETEDDIDQKIERININTEKLNMNEDRLQEVNRVIEELREELNKDIPKRHSEIKVLQDFANYTTSKINFIESLENPIRELEGKLEFLLDDNYELEDELTEVNSNIDLILEEVLNIKNSIRRCNENLNKFSEYNSTEIIDEDLNTLLAQYESFTKNSSSGIEELNKEISNQKNLLSKKKKKFDNRKSEVTNFNLSDLDYLDYVEDRSSYYGKIRDEKEEIAKNIASIEKDINALSEVIGQMKENVKTLRNQLKKRFGVLSQEEILSKDSIRNINFIEEIQNLESLIQSIKIDIGSKEVEMDDILSIKDTISSYSVEMTHLEPSEFPVVKSYEETVQDIIEEVTSNKSLLEASRSVLSRLVDETLYMRLDGIDMDKIGVRQVLMEHKDEIEGQGEAIMNFITTIGKWIEFRKVKEDTLLNKREILKSQLGDYTKKLIEEIKLINKISNFKGQKLFEIKLKDSEISMNRIDDIIHSIVEEPNITEEFIFSQVNSYNLLNTVHPLSKISIRVLRFEANNKSEMMNWRKMKATPSGAQKFCISLIVLSLFISYKRYNSGFKDADGRSSKVLLMDNPFGQTSDETFLKNVFDFANNLGVQIIAYTHVKQMSVRNNYNYIYTMSCRKIAGASKDIVAIESVKRSKEKTDIIDFTVERDKTATKDDILKTI